MNQDKDFDIRFIGKAHPKADLTCERCWGRAWTIIVAADKGPAVFTVQKCDSCNQYPDDVSAANEARKYVRVRNEFPCYITEHSSYQCLEEKDVIRTAGFWYHRYLQLPYLLLSEVFDENNKPVIRIGVTEAERIVSGVNAKIVLGRERRFIQKDLADALKSAGVSFEKEENKATRILQSAVEEAL